MRLAIVILGLLLQPAAATACETADLITAMSSSAGDGIILTRPEMQHQWATPDGIFKIHYDTEGPLAVYHPDEDIDPADGIPDYVNRCAEFLHLSHEVIIDDLDYDPPPLDGDQGGDSRYDIYLTDVPALTTPESPSDQYPGRPAYSSYIQLGRDMRTPRYPDDPYPFLKVSAAHEYFHATEFAYRAYSSDATAWWFESCAVWIEEVVFDDINDAYYQIPDYFQRLNKSLYQTPGLFIYGAWLYPEFISEQFGSWVIKGCWEKFASFDLAVEAIRLAYNEYGIDFNVEYCRHIIWNYFTEINYRSGFYEEGEFFGATVVIAREHSEYPVLWNDHPIDQENVSGAYIVFSKAEISKGSLVLVYNNTSGDLHYLGIAVLRLDGEVEYSIHRISSDISPNFVIEDFAECDRVVMMPVWAYEGIPIEGTTRYAYRAYIDSTSTAVASNDPAAVEFDVAGAYPNPFNGSVSISFYSPLEDRYDIIVHDVLGRRVAVESGLAGPGLNIVHLNIPGHLAGGVLFYTVEQGDNRGGGKILYLK
jgi:hypothetical protein